MSIPSHTKDKAVVVGVYGLPGCGKTFLLGRLRAKLGDEEFGFYEGSEVIASVVPGGLGVFQKLDEEEKVQWRQLAIDKIAQECVDTNRVGVVAGHCMFWPEENDVGKPVHTRNDLDVYTHILYLDTPAELIEKRRLQDTQRSRPIASARHLRKWQEAEQAELRGLCRKNGILFMRVSAPQHTVLDRLSALLVEFRCHNPEQNLSRAKSRLDEILASSPSRNQVKTVLVMDADKTLAAEDTGTLFWEMAIASGYLQPGHGSCPLKELFGSSLGYSYTAFRQATLLYEEAVGDVEFDAICHNVATKVAMRSEFVRLLKLVEDHEDVVALVVSCGLRRVWDKVLEREGLSKTVEVIGGGRLADGFVVTAEVKAALVGRLRDVHQVSVWAFGDSVLDLPMLFRAHHAIVVVGEEQTRSKSMDAALSRAIDNDGLHARQALLPSDVRPRLDTTRLPLVELSDRDFIDAILGTRKQPAASRLLHATDCNASKLLTAPTRDARIAGPTLREAHRRVGWYLAVEFLAHVVGVEEYMIPHVQGHQTTGHRLLHEQETSIVALMRGGEAMAFGVNDVFPRAMFIHAFEPGDVKLHHVQKQHMVVIVDSVINSGKTIVEFVQHIRALKGAVRIVVIAGVVQAQSVSEGRLAQILEHDKNFTVIALRLSSNKFTGRGTTDTGNRLFNTTHVD
ncbi:uracil phosphoribosyltransferase-domain-containing protein [Diplogelasinospora grovesii]|uniref:Uracil phosphoribosyltransferase-domain-containing protein n=1 Tax=Diplogelasinospora grovesii TaxID=303347 RepID=A0AAN6S8X9_9PEZI|nr:uracil phosphoribosyltransferase-domain-containing protein [Diplogelasinospora grovesii]